MTHPEGKFKIDMKYAESSKRMKPLSKALLMEEFSVLEIVSRFRDSPS